MARPKKSDTVVSSIPSVTETELVNRYSVKFENDEQLCEEDQKNRREILKIFRYDPFENETIHDQKQLYRDLVSMCDEAIGEDLPKMRGAITLVRSYLRADRLTEAIQKLSIDAETMIEHAKELKTMTEMLTRETDMITKTVKDFGFAERYATAKSRGSGTLGAVVRDIENFNYDDGTGVVYTASLEEQTEATAKENEILISKTAWVNGVKVTGTMANKGAVSATLNAGETYNIPSGYHNGAGSITAQTLESQTIADAVAENLLINKTAWVNGVQITGSMVDNGAVSVTLNAGETYTVPLGFHDGTGLIETSSLASQTVADAEAGDILSPKTAWVNGTQITGTITTSALKSVRVNSGNDVTLPAGYYPDGITIYSLYTDRLDLTGTNAWYDEENQALYPEDSGYVDGSSLVVTAEILS